MVSAAVLVVTQKRLTSTAGKSGGAANDPAHRIVRRLQRPHYRRSATDDTGSDDLWQDPKEVIDFVDG